MDDESGAHSALPTTADDKLDLPGFEETEEGGGELTLRHKFKRDDTTIVSKLIIRPMTVGDQRRMETMSGTPTKQAFWLCENLTGLSAKELDRLNMRDFQRLQQVVRHFCGLPPPTDQPDGVMAK